MLHAKTCKTACSRYVSAPTNVPCMKALKSLKAPLKNQRTQVVVRQRGNEERSRDTATRATETASAADLDVEWARLSYSEQYDKLYKSSVFNTRQVIDKPDREKQATEEGAVKVILSDVHGVGKRPLFKNRDWKITDVYYAIFIGAMHIAALAAPLTASWNMAGLFGITYFVSGCLGITLSYHRMLAHKAFQTPKWLEYTLAYCGVLAVQGDPLEWASSHRYHHLHTDTPLDPHSPYEGFWWSHMGWLLDNEATIKRVGNRSNANDMEAQPFYRFLRDTYIWHVVAQFAALFLIGGLPAMVWGGAVRIVWVYHITWMVNSACHCWGTQAFNTGDLSRNNWWVGLLAWGEGWHNNHHAFEFSARHGFEWWQLDITWYVIQGLQALGLATNVKLPSERQKARLAFATVNGAEVA
jgi:stearoyl-CoA desaturase (delta-9 desaturase)